MPSMFHLEKVRPPTVIESPLKLTRKEKSEEKKAVKAEKKKAKKKENE